MMILGKALLAGLGMMLWSSVAMAGDQDFRLVNATGYQIDSIFVSSSRTTEWEEDVMGRDALADGDAVDISFSAGERGCLFDLLAVYNDGEEAVWERFDLCTISQIILQYDRAGGTTTATYE